MPDRPPRRVSPPEMAASDSAITLAVFYRGDQAIPQLTALQTLGVRLEFIPAGTEWTLGPGVTGVLWELALEDGAQRLVSALVAGVPAASFGLTSQPAIPELSRALGFRAHLLPPFSLGGIERALGLGDSIDLADRLDAVSGLVQRSAAQPDAVASVMRAVGTHDRAAERGSRPRGACRGMDSARRVARVCGGAGRGTAPARESGVRVVFVLGVGRTGGGRRDCSHRTVRRPGDELPRRADRSAKGARRSSTKPQRSAGRSSSTVPSSVSSSASTVAGRVGCRS